MRPATSAGSALAKQVKHVSKAVNHVSKVVKHVSKATGSGADEKRRRARGFALLALLAIYLLYY